MWRNVFHRIMYYNHKINVVCSPPLDSKIYVMYHTWFDMNITLSVLKIKRLKAEMSTFKPLNPLNERLSVNIVKSST